MMNEFTLKVRDIFTREHFRHAKVLSGSRGLDRVIRWVHVLEVEDFGSLINGGELILTTGVGLHLDFSAQLKFVQQLIASNAAGICIEKGPYIQEIHEDILELAEKNDFPIIMFEETVKFVDITQELHSLIINRHHDLLRYLDTSSRKFIELSMSPNGVVKILHELYDYFHRTIIFVPTQGKSFYYPSDKKHFHALIMDHFQSIENETISQRMLTIDDESFVLMPIGGLGQIWGYLCLHTTEEAPEEFHFLILDRAALAIAQILLRNRTIEERKQHSEDKFVRAILQGREYDTEDLINHLPFAGPDMKYRVFVMEIQPPDRMMNEEDWEDIKLQRSLMIRGIFKRFGFSPAVSATKEEIAVIAAFPVNAREKVKVILQRLIQFILQAKGRKEFLGNNRIYGVGREYSQIDQLSKSYAEAKEVVALNHSTIKEKMITYDDIGVYRLLLPLKKSGELSTYVKDYLGPILDYDSRADSDLYETLKVYLACGRSKKEAAEKLYVVRQTLYHRLEKIEQLLGKDYMDSDHRIAIETAIKAYELLKES